MQTISPNYSILSRPLAARNRRYPSILQIGMAVVTGHVVFLLFLLL